MRKTILFLAVLLFSTMSVFAQRKATGTGMIMGNVTDSVSKLPIEYVSIGVYTVDKDSLVSGIVTDSTGKFLLQKIPNGKFVVKFSFIGYKPFASKEITIDAKQQFVMLEPVVLNPTSSTLGAVSVEGQRKPFEQTFNKKIFLMDDKRTAGAQTALDLLKTLPSVTVDEEGNVKFRGQSPTILVDNQPYHLLYPKLEMIPAANCDKVEFIEPSARFASSVGTINIKLKKPKEKGLSGAIYANAGTWDFEKASNYYSGMNINYKYKKLILFANGYYGGNVFENKNSSSNSFMYNDSTFISEFEGNTNGNSLWGSANAGMMYLFSNTKKLTVTWTPSLNNYSYDYNGIGSSRMGDITREREANNSNSEHSYFSNGGTISYRDNPEDDSKEFSIEASYSRQGNNSKSLNKNTYSIYNFHAFVPDSIALINQPMDETSDEFSLEVYNRKNIDSTGRWEVGAEIEGTHTVKESKYLFNNIFKNEFSRSEESLGMMSAAYGNFGTKKKKWKFDAGLRLALGSINYNVYANYSGKDTTLKVERYVPMILPSLSVGYEIKPMHELKVSYSYDVQEPQIYQLDPYINRSEPRAISSGNSQLDPYRFHRFTFGYMFSPGPFSLSLDAFTNYSNNYVDDVTETINSLVVYSKPYNVGKLTQSGLTFSASGMPVQWFNANVSFDVFRSTLDATQLTAELQTMPVTTSGLVTTNWTVSGNFYMNITIKKKYNLSMYMNNGGRNTSIGGYNKGGMYSNISLSRKFFNRMLNVSIGVQNVIDKWASYDYSQSYLGRTSTNSWESSWGRRSFRLSLRWYFNKGDRGTMSNQGAPQGGGPGGKK